MRCCSAAGSRAGVLAAQPNIALATCASDSPASPYRRRPSATSGTVSMSNTRTFISVPPASAPRPRPPVPPRR